ncbi:MAG: cell division protein FtsQ/DivIB [Sphingomonadales bacterium]|nr:cell division protein FtsQ/DivIB [Sphingomonadales bacterium]
MTRAATVKRGGKRPVVKARSRKSAQKTASAWSKARKAMPFKQDSIDRFVTWSMAGMVGVAVVAGAMMAGLPGYVGTAVAGSIGRAGFAVKRVEVTGIDRMERLTVYAIALDQHSMAMPLVDLDKVRSQLLGFGWIEDARVSRRLPDTLVVDIVERKPAAIWQHNQQLSLIDAHGVILEPVALDAMPDLPLLIGSDANEKATALSELMERAPALKPMLAAATWVGGRRWDLRFQSGETLALPEGDDLAGKSLVRFAQMDGVQRLLGRGYARFDMRDPTKFVAKIDKSKPTIDAPKESVGETKGEETGGTA